MKTITRPTRDLLCCSTLLYWRIGGFMTGSWPIRIVRGGCPLSIVFLPCWNEWCQELLELVWTHSMAQQVKWGFLLGFCASLVQCWTTRSPSTQNIWPHFMHFVTFFKKNPVPLTSIIHLEFQGFSAFNHLKAKLLNYQWCIWTTITTHNWSYFEHFKWKDHHVCSCSRDTDHIHHQLSTKLRPNEYCQTDSAHSASDVQTKSTGRGIKHSWEERDTWEKTNSVSCSQFSSVEFLRAQVYSQSGVATYSGRLAVARPFYKACSYLFSPDPLIKLAK